MPLIEPGKLCLTPLTTYGVCVVGPVPVPKKVTQCCRTMWDIGGVVGMTTGGWRFIEVWNVSP